MLKGFEQSIVPVWRDEDDLSLGISKNERVVLARPFGEILFDRGSEVGLNKREIGVNRRSEIIAQLFIECRLIEVPEVPENSAHRHFDVSLGAQCLGHGRKRNDVPLR